MASRKLVRDFLLSKQFLSHRLSTQQVPNFRLRLVFTNGFSHSRQFSVFNEFSKNVKGEAQSNPEFQQSIKELKEKAGELKGVKEELKVRTKQKTEQLYKQVDGVWTEAETTAKKVSANVKEKISAATEEVKENFGTGKQESSESGNASAKDGAEDGSKAMPGEKQQQSGPSNTSETFYGKFKSGVSSASPKISLAFQKLKEAKVVDLAKKGYDIVKDELSGKPIKRKRKMQDATNSASPTVERSTKTDVVVVPVKQSRWNKKWESLKEKMQGHPIFKRISGLSEPVVTKGQEVRFKTNIVCLFSSSYIILTCYYEVSYLDPGQHGVIIIHAYMPTIISLTKIGILIYGKKGEVLILNCPARICLC